MTKETGMSDTEVAREEAIVRRVNEAIEDGVWPGDGEELIRMRCECGRFDCNAGIEIRVGAYEQVRADGRRFIVSAGHQRPDVETVVERTAGYLVVEKFGAAGETAERLDPRD